MIVSKFGNSIVFIDSIYASLFMGLPLPLGTSYFIGP